MTSSSRVPLADVRCTVEGWCLSLRNVVYYVVWARVVWGPESAARVVWEGCCADYVQIQLNANFDKICNPNVK